MGEPTISEIIPNTLDGAHYTIVRTVYGIDIEFDISFISQISKWRIDVRVDNVFVSRKHYETSLDFSEQLKIIGLD